MIKTSNSGLPLELEVETLDQITEALTMQVDGYLLDNMPPAIIKKAVELIRNAEQGAKIFIEASGGITLEKLKVFASTGIEAISVGALTTGVKNTNLKMEFKTL